MVRHTNHLIVLLFVLTTNLLAQNGAIKGQVIDAATRDPLPGINVLIEGTYTGATTAADGRFTIAPVPLGAHNLVFSAIGYRTLVRTDVIVRAGRTAYVNTGLEEQAVQGVETVVTAQYFQKDEGEATSAFSFSAEEVRRAPGAGQEFSRVLNALPGVASQGETSQDLLVRGGSPSENAFYVDDIPMPAVQHFTDGNGASNGPVGIVNTEFIEDIDFYTGGFSAAYGDRLSSISAIRYREGNADAFDMQLDLNFTGAGAILEGPLKDGHGQTRGTWFVSGRRSYLDLLAGAIDAGGAPRFGDAQAKLVYRLTPNHRLTLLNIYGSSRFKQDRSDAVEEGFVDYIDAINSQNTLGLNWRALWGGRGYSTTSLAFSYRDFDADAQRTADGARVWDQEGLYRWVHLRNVNYLRLGRRLKVEFGADVQRQSGDLLYDFAPQPDRTGQVQPRYLSDLDIAGTRAGAFASLVLQPTKRWQTTLGLRADVNSFNDDYTLSPRLSTTYRLSQRLALNAAAGLYYQGLPLQLMAHNQANRRLDDVRAVQYVAGLEYLLTPSTRLTLEVYDKDYSQAPSLPTDGPIQDPLYVLDSRQPIFFDRLVSQGQAYARGVEALLQKKLATGFYGMVSGSLFRTRYRDLQGRWRDRDFDNRYLFSVIGGYKPSNAWEVSVRWSYIGGRPTTPVDAAASAQAGDLVLDAARFNQDRLPAYHSLFVRADRRFNFSDRNLVLYLSVWNAYNRANVSDRYWNVVDQKVDDATEFALLPIFGMEFEF